MKVIILSEYENLKPEKVEYEIMEVERKDGRAYGTCPYCGTEVSHGDGNGMRIPHCDCVSEYFIFNKESPDVSAFEETAHLIRDYINGKEDGFVTFDLDEVKFTIYIEESKKKQTHLADLL